MRPRILYITAHLPHAPSSGSELRSRHVVRALEEIGEVGLCVVAGRAANEDSVRAARGEFEIERFVCGRRAQASSLARRLRDAWNPRRMNLYGMVATDEEKAWLEGALDRFDLIWMHQLYVSYVFDRWHWPRSVMDIDDVPSTYEGTRRENGGNLSGRLAAEWKMRRWRAREALLGERFDALAVCSEADRDYLGPVAPVHVIPNGFERPAGEPLRRPAAPPRIGFIGLMDYVPNAEGIRWFVRECWPAIKRAVPDARLRLAGKGSDRLGLPGPDIDGLGWVDDPADEIATWSLMIVPLRAGAGTRIKVAEAFGRKCPLVSTGIGAFGYDVKSGSELWIADRAEDFSGACLRVLRDPAAAAGMAERAWVRFLREWTWEAMYPSVRSAADEVLHRGPQGGVRKAAAGAALSPASRGGMEGNFSRRAGLG